MQMDLDKIRKYIAYPVNVGHKTSLISDSRSCPAARPNQDLHTYLGEQHPRFQRVVTFCQIQTLGLGKRSKVPLYSLLKRTPVSLLTGWPLIWKSGLQAGSGSGIQAGWPKRSAMARPAHPCYANPLSCYWTNHALRYVTSDKDTHTNMFHRHHQFKTMSAFSALPCLPINCCWS